MTFDLKADRLNAGFSIRGLAREIDVPEQTIRRVEAGLGAEPANLKKIADYFGTTVVDVLDSIEEIAA